ncbi:hypothetical protein XENOCAPTIV_007230 [Xenoophorus captivus]|uniref:Choline/carnitine acyltransferase domain-containing protein n=1 Tax=Xenoophorus captivus TaxID=1517983 RepID=A0ABV0RR48_9TELE
MASRLADTLPERTFQYQNSLPPLPVPSLEGSLSKYLDAVRIPSQLNVNFGGPGPYLEHFWPPAEGNSLQRTSVVTWHTLQYWDLLRTERLAPQKAGKTPLDMDQFRMLYSTCKVPGVKKDTIRNYFKTGGTSSTAICSCQTHLMPLTRFFTAG